MNLDLIHILFLHLIDLVYFIEMLFSCLNLIMLFSSHKMDSSLLLMNLTDLLFKTLIND